MALDLTQFEPITNENKDDLMAWLEENIEILSDPNYAGRISRKTNRIFGTDKDDVDELAPLLGRVLVTLQRNNLL